MKTELLKSLSSFKAPLKINNITKAIAISGLAMGAAAMIPAAPAGAVRLNSGTFGFSDGTADFFTSPDQTSYTVNFNPSPNSSPTGSARISNATESFSSTFAVGELRAVTPSTGTFNLVSGNTFRLVGSALSFAFPSSNGVTVSIAPESTFTRTLNSDFGVGFANLDVTATVSNDDGTFNLPSIAFTFNDTLGAGGGGYSFVGSPTSPVTAVPEPFTVIGSLVGGAAALRMRKKLANATKK